MKDEIFGPNSLVSYWRTLRLSFLIASNGVPLLPLPDTLSFFKFYLIFKGLLSLKEKQLQKVFASPSTNHALQSKASSQGIN